MNAPIIESPIRLTLTRSFDVTAARLFDAFVSESFGDWLGSEGLVCLSCEIDAHVGGAWKTVHRLPDGQVLEHAGVYKQLDRPSCLSFTWSGGCGGAHVTLVTVTFKPKGAGTEMTLVHEGFHDTGTVERHEQGWAASFARLGRWLAG